MTQSVDQAMLRAKTLIKNGDLHAARQVYAALLERYPGNKRAAEALNALAGARPGRNAAAAGAHSVETQLQALLDLYRQGRPQDALRMGTELAAKFPQVPQIPNILGAVNTILGRVPEAIASYRNAVRLDPGYAEAHHNLGNALRAMGQKNEALASFAKAIQLRPDYAEAHRNLSTLKTFTVDDPQIAVLNRLLVASGTSDKDRMHASFALAKACEDLGQTDVTFAHFLEGNRLRKTSMDYDIATDRKLFAQIRSNFSSIQPLGDSRTALPKRPIFIVGMPRSGTTLVEQILASHSQVHGAGELNVLNTLASRALKSGRGDPQAALSKDAIAGIRVEYGATLTSLAGSRPVVTDKMPSNFRWIGLIVAALPEARIVCVRRDPVATCWSAFKTYFATNGNGFTNDLSDVGEYHRMYRDLMVFWRDLYPGQIYDLDYESLTEDQAEETRKLLQFCGLDWEDGCLEFHATKRVVETASSSQVRQKMYKGSSDSWRVYERHLSPLIAALGNTERAMK